MDQKLFEKVLGLESGEIIRKYNIPKPKMFKKDTHDIYLGINRDGLHYARVVEREIIRVTVVGIVVISEDGRLSFEVDAPDEKPWWLFELTRCNTGRIYMIYSDKKYLAVVKTSGESYRIVQEDDRKMTKWKDVPDLTKRDHDLVKFAIQHFQESLDV
jgi:hypothetical protein